MKNLLNLLFSPKGEISNSVFVLGVVLSFVLFVLMTGICILARVIPGFQGAAFNATFAVVFCSFLCQIAALTSKRVRDIGFSVFASKAGRRILRIFLVFVRIGVYLCVLTALGLLWQAFQIPEQVERSGHLRVVECTSPFGSWFNMNALTVEPGRFVYEKNGFLSPANESIPFAKVRKIVFTNGLIWNRIVIATGRLPFSGREMYVLQDANFRLIKDRIESLAGATLILEENRTLLRRIRSALPGAADESAP